MSDFAQNIVSKSFIPLGHPNILIEHWHWPVRNHLKEISFPLTANYSNISKSSLLWFLGGFCEKISVSGKMYGTTKKQADQHLFETDYVLGTTFKFWDTKTNESLSSKNPTSKSKYICKSKRYRKPNYLKNYETAEQPHICVTLYLHRTGYK